LDVEGLEFFVDLLMVDFTKGKFDEAGLNVELFFEIEVLFEYSLDDFFNDEVHNGSKCLIDLVSGVKDNCCIGWIWKLKKGQ
jgi:hypothetical protein